MFSCNHSCVDTVTARAIVIEALEQAGKTMLAMPSKGYSTAVRIGGMEYVRDAVEAYGWGDVSIRPPTPSSLEIDAMDEWLPRISLIPPEKMVFRRIVGARSLVHPLHDRHLFDWRKIGRMLGCDYRAVQTWHRQAIDLIVAKLPREIISDWDCSTRSEMCQ